MTAAASDDDWYFDPSLAAMQRSLRRELREEAEEVEAIIDESELRARTIADVAMEARNRGDVVAIATQRRVFNGHIAYAAGDFITLTAEGFQADINVASVNFLRVIERGTRGGKAGSDGPGTFEMRLLERRSPIDRIELGYMTRDETTMGRIITVGQDHIVLMSDQREEWTIPLTAIAWVIRRRQTR